jgi:hypothetical protein
MDCEHPKGKTVMIAGVVGRMDAHIHACGIDPTSAVAARLALTKRGDDVAGIGKPLKPAGDGGAPGLRHLLLRSPNLGFALQNGAKA